VPLVAGEWQRRDLMILLPAHRGKQRARRAKYCPIAWGWRLTTDRQSAWTAVVRCRPRSLWRHYECRQVDASTDGTAPGQQYSPPSLLQRALTSPLTPRIPFTAVDGCSEWNARRGGRVPAGAADSRSRLLDSVTGFWEMKPDTALKNGYRSTRLPFYNLRSNHSYLPSITNIWPLPNYTAWWQRQVTSQNPFIHKPFMQKVIYSMNDRFVCILVFASVWTRGPKPLREHSRE